MNCQQNIGNTKDLITLLLIIMVNLQDICNKYFFFINFFLDNELLKPLRFVKIKFDAPVFDKVTKDRAAKFVDQLSAIGGTMGLLTGFSIISAVEIVYFAIKIAFGYYNTFKENLLNPSKFIN